MGFFSWLMGLFSGWSSDSRYAEEKTEARIEKNERRITRTEEGMEKDERNMLKLIKNDLASFNKRIMDNKIPNIEIKIGNQFASLSQCIFVLLQYIDTLIKDKLSIKQELLMVGNINTYWRVVEEGMRILMSQLLRSNNKNRGKLIKQITSLTGQVTELFNKFAKEVRVEESVSRWKLKLVSEQYKLIMREEGTSTTPAAPQQVNSAGAKQQINAAQRQAGNQKPAMAMR